MAIGTYPFRCLDCNARFSVNVFFLSRLAFAKCPKCLRMELTSWQHKSYHLGLLTKLMITFGARRYRCAACRCNFVSFRPKAVAQPAEMMVPQAEPAIGEAAVPNNAEISNNAG